MYLNTMYAVSCVVAFLCFVLRELHHHFLVLLNETPKNTLIQGNHELMRVF